jgi:hypothetical protein
LPANALAVLADLFVDQDHILHCYLLCPEGRLRNERLHCNTLGIDCQLLDEGRRQRVDLDYG